MANVPTGTTFSVATAFGTALTVTGVTNANPAVVTTSTAHSYSNGDVVEITNGWGRVTKRVFEIGAVTSTTFTLVGLDTSSTTTYPSSGGAGTVRKVTTWVQLTKVMNPQTSGGDPKQVTYKYLESDVEFSINDGFTPTSYSMELDDDDTTAGYTALRNLTDVQSDTVLKMLLRNGSRVYIPGRAALNDVPRLTEGQVNRITLSFNGNNRHSRYSA
jgi:hypothetical protein